MRPETVLFVACGVAPDADLPRFHEHAQRLGVAHGYPSHLAPGRVAWACVELDPLLATARALLEVCPGVSLSLHAATPDAHIPISMGPPLFFGAGATHALDLLDRTPPGRVLASEDTLRLFGGFDASAHGFSVLEASDVHVFVPTAARESTLAQDVFARWQRASDEERAEAVTNLVERAIADLMGGEPLHLLSLVHVHIERVVEIVVESSARDPETSARVLIALSQWINPVWMRPELVGACAALVDASPLEASSPEARPRLLDLYALRALQLRKLGLIDNADAMLERIISCAQGFTTVEARALNERALLRIMTRDFSDVEAYAERVVALVGEEAPSTALVLAHKVRAVSILSDGEDVTDSRTATIFHHLERAYSIAQACGDRQNIMLVAGEWSNALSKIDPTRSAARMQEVLELARALHVDHFVTVAMSVLTDLALRRGRTQEAHAMLARSRNALDSHDARGRWFVLVQEALVCLFEADYARAHALTHDLHEGLSMFQHPQAENTVFMIDACAALLSGQLEQFRYLLAHAPNADIPYLDLFVALAHAMEAPADTLEAALSHLRKVLVEADEEGPYDEWHGLMWHHSIARFPDHLVAAYQRACVAVGPEGAWLVNTEGKRIELAHRPYLHRLLAAFVDLHERDDGGTLDTHTVFEHGWPGETVTFEAMKNRVYVGISKLRGFGLKPWLVSGPDGYFLSPDLLVVRAIPSEVTSR